MQLTLFCKSFERCNNHIVPVDESRRWNNRRVTIIVIMCAWQFTFETEWTSNSMRLSDSKLLFRILFLHNRTQSQLMWFVVFKSNICKIKFAKNSEKIRHQAVKRILPARKGLSGSDVEVEGKLAAEWCGNLISGCLIMWCC